MKVVPMPNGAMSYLEPVEYHTSFKACKKAELQCKYTGMPEKFLKRVWKGGLTWVCSSCCCTRVLFLAFSAGSSVCRPYTNQHMRSY